MRQRTISGLSGLRKRLRRPLAFYLAALLLVAIIPSFLFSMVVLKRSMDDQERVVTALLKASTGSVTRAVEREVDGMLTTLRVLAATRSLENDDLGAFYRRASSALAGTGMNLLIIDRSYQQLLNTRIPFGQPLGRASDPVSVDQAFRSGVPLVSPVFFGRTAQTWVFNVYLPVFSADRRGDYLMTLTRDAVSLERSIGRDVLSPGWNAAIIDGAGDVVAASDPKVEPGNPFFMSIVPSLRVGVGEADEGGTRYRTVTEFSVLSGWKIVAWAKASDVEAAARRSYAWLAGGALVFAAIALGISLAIARMMSRGVRLLADDARRLGQGKPVALRPHMVEEVTIVSTALSEAAEERARAEAEIRFLMREVAHRSKNQLSVIQSMLSQSMPSQSGASPESRQDFVESFRRRVAGLARSTDLMIANAAQGIDMDELAHNQLQPFIPDDGDRFHISGPPVRLDTQVSQTLGMALHELATNATKYGALANAYGRVDLFWTLEEGTFRLVWRESLADLTPEMRAPGRKGFGTLVLERMLGMSLDARLQRLMHEDGIEWRVEIDSARLNTPAPGGGKDAAAE
ncbi:sensor histidine kinase [Rhizobium sp. 9140]|uniref:sensor histidine kinase n=1 Tax=Rhizobium sp. 9140 TaxID=1761900 RepID=UPI001FDA8D7E|nr:sensor histidine kinase [Rhizobium sp. 9140]